MYAASSFDDQAEMYPNSVVDSSLLMSTAQGAHSEVIGDSGWLSPHCGGDDQGGVEHARPRQLGLEPDQRVENRCGQEAANPAGTGPPNGSASISADRSMPLCLR